MRLLIVLLAISRLATCSPYRGVTIGFTPYSAPVHSQYHAQDKYGQYVYGYASDSHSKDESKTADGITRGGYSYIDANGVLQTVRYVSDPVNGFRVSASNIPHDLPEVAVAKAQHYRAYLNIKAQHAAIAAGRVPIVISPVPVAESLVAPIRVAHIAPAASRVLPVAAYPPVQYHVPDRSGQYTYGYAGPLSSKQESKAGGVTRGGYSYIDANGMLQTVQYVSDPVHGFRVEATNLPEAPNVQLIGARVTATAVADPKDDDPVLTGPIALESNQVLQPIPSPSLVPPALSAPRYSSDEPVFTNPPALQPEPQPVRYVNHHSDASFLQRSLPISQDPPVNIYNRDDEHVIPIHHGRFATVNVPQLQQVPLNPELIPTGNEPVLNVPTHQPGRFLPQNRESVIAVQQIPLNHELTANGNAPANQEPPVYPSNIPTDPAGRPVVNVPVRQEPAPVRIIPVNVPQNYDQTIQVTGDSRQSYEPTPLIQEAAVYPSDIPPTPAGRPVVNVPVRQEPAPVRIIPVNVQRSQVTGDNRQSYEPTLLINENIQEAAVYPSNIPPASAGRPVVNVQVRQKPSPVRLVPINIPQNYDPRLQVVGDARQSYEPTPLTNENIPNIRQPQGPPVRLAPIEEVPSGIPQNNPSQYQGISIPSGNPQNNPGQYQRIPVRRVKVHRRPAGRRNQIGRIVVPDLPASHPSVENLSYRDQPAPIIGPAPAQPIPPSSVLPQNIIRAEGQQIPYLPVSETLPTIPSPGTRQPGLILAHNPADPQIAAGFPAGAPVSLVPSLNREQKPLFISAPVPEVPDPSPGRQIATDPPTKTAITYAAAPAFASGVQSGADRGNLVPIDQTAVAHQANEGDSGIPPAFRESISDGLPAGQRASLAPRVQQVQQTPVSEAGPEQQALFHVQENVSQQPAKISEPTIKGPTGFYKTNINYEG